MVEFINELEYKKLRDKDLTDNHEAWILRNNLQVHKVINTLFKEDKFLQHLCFDDTCCLHGINKPLSKLEVSKLPTKYPYLDHFYSVSLNENVSKFNQPYSVKGIFNFPYINFNDAIKVCQELGRMWNGYVINPYLMRYNDSIGMFYHMAMDHFESIVEDINGYVKKQTGYDLFYQPVRDEVPEIIEDFPVLTIDNFVKLHTHKEPFAKDNNHHIGWNKLLKFWGENDCVTCKELNNYFEYYLENIGYTIWGVDWNLKTIESTKPFILINPKNNDQLGPFTHCELDLSFNCIYTGNYNELSLTSEQVQDLRNGEYDFKFI